MGFNNLPSERLSLAVFVSHPIQHFSPLFKELAQLVNLHVFYYSDFAQKSGQVDPGFGVAVQWDVPLLEGYEHTFLEPVPWQIASYLGPWKQNCKIWQSVFQRPWDGILLFGYSYLNDWIVWLSANLKHTPILLISDSELLHTRAWIKKVSKELPVRIFYRYVSAFLAVGDNNKRYAQRYGVPDSKIYQAALPVDIQRFRAITEFSDRDVVLRTLRQKYHIPTHSKVVLFCGKLVDYKRPLDLVLALKELNDNQDIIGLFVGTGDLKHQILDLGKNCVRITGFVNQHEIPLHYLLGDVLVVPSDRDPHPLVVTEAACLGVPSIVSDRVGCIGPNDMVRNNETGIVFPCGDTKALASAIQTILQDDNLRVLLGNRALEVSETQSPRAVASSISKVMSSLSIHLKK